MNDVALQDDGMHAMDRAGGGMDRIGDLPCEILGHILSYLPNKEAGRAAVLSRRWRYVFGHVHTISFEEDEGERADDWITFYFEAKERKSCSSDLLDTINDALLCRRRCAGAHVPLRSFHFAFDDKHWWDDVIINRWISYVVHDNTRDLNLDLQFGLTPICSGRTDDIESSSDDDDDEPSPTPRRSSVLPESLFSCVGLQTLRLSYCELELPVSINLPNVETLHLTGILDDGRSIRRLISSCPRLADLTLQAQSKLTRVSVLNKRLRRFALRCCHGVKSVDIDASELTTLVYRGKVPAESLLTLHRGSPRISSCTVDFCRKTPFAAQVEFDAMAKFLGKFTGTRHLHLESSCLGSCVESKFFMEFPSFPTLRRLELTGCLETNGAINAVRRILDKTPNLEVLSLFFKPPHDQDSEYIPPKKTKRCKDPFVDADAAKFSSLWCLQRRMREINLVHYIGDVEQRLLARLLLGNAVVLEEVCVVLPRKTLKWQNKRKHEIELWVVNKSANAIFL